MPGERTDIELKMCGIRFELSMNAPASWSAAVLCRFRKPDSPIFHRKTCLPQFPLPTNSKPGMETKAALIICHPELAKDLTACQLALCHPLPFSKLTAPHDESSVLIAGRPKRTSGSPREIPSTDSGQALRRLRMTAFGDPFLLVRPVFKLVGNGKRGLPQSKTLARLTSPCRFKSAVLNQLKY